MEQTKNKDTFLIKVGEGTLKLKNNPELNKETLSIKESIKSVTLTKKFNGNEDMHTPGVDIKVGNKAINFNSATSVLISNNQVEPSIRVASEAPLFIPGNVSEDIQQNCKNGFEELITKREGSSEMKRSESNKEDVTMKSSKDKTDQSTS